MLFFTEFGKEFFSTFIKFLYAPLIFKEILWIFIPLLIAIALMELYFSRYPRESIGHHKALENTIFIIFVAFDILRHILRGGEMTSLKIAAAGIFIIIAGAVSFFDFFHRLPTKLRFKMSSKFVIGYITYAAIVLIYSDLLIDTSGLHIAAVLISVAAVFFLLVGARNIMSFLEPKSYEEIEHFLKHVEEDIQKAVEESDRETKKVLEEEKKIAKMAKK